ncbi:MAG: hypothetical protein LUQ38_04780 [Methanotrichaceae archaeon]|nr:hypothetical protein [Methanotrichaceae archaeon]
MLLYSPGINPFLEDLSKGADRVFYFEEGPRGIPRSLPKLGRKMNDQRNIRDVS